MFEVDVKNVTEWNGEGEGEEEGTSSGLGFWLFYYNKTWFLCALVCNLFSRPNMEI